MIFQEALNQFLVADHIILPRLMIIKILVILVDVLPKVM